MWLAAAAPSWAGSIPTWALLVVAFVAARKIGQGGGSGAVQELSAANKTLEEALQDAREKLGGEIRDLKVENAELRTKTDVATAIEHWGRGYETRAQERHDESLAVLKEISDKLPAIA